MLTRFKKIISPFSVILISAGLIALLYLIALAATSYQVNSGATVTIDEWSACKKVTNNNALALFVPTNTALEWTTFKTNAPNITLADCISVPLAPASLAANPGDTQASLVWTVPSSDGGSAITSYKVYRSTTSGGEVLVTSGGCSGLGNVLTCTDTGLTNAIAYYYKVSAVNAIGEGALSAEATVYPGSKRIFITSTLYNGNLGGLAGADANCQARANAVSLGGTWKAWISSGATDIISAADRLTHSSSLYVNMIGTKVANNWADLVDGSLAAAIQYTENRTSYSGQVWTGSNYNGTNYFSQDCSGTGAGWTVTTGTGGDAGLSGIASSITGSWSNSGANSCDSSLALYCFEQGIITAPDAPTNLAGTAGNEQVTLTWTAPYNGGSIITSYKVYRGTTSGGEVLVTSGGCSSLGNVVTCIDTGIVNEIPYYYKISAVNAIGESSLTSQITSTPTTPKRIFITSTLYNGNLGGIAGADAKCTSAALAAGLTGSYKAWISSGATDPVNAADRVTHSTSPYLNMNGQQVANNWADLVDGSLAAGVHYTEFGGTPTEYYVFTGTNQDGSKYLSYDCSGTGAAWTVTTGTGDDAGVCGNASNTTSWSRYGACNCDTTRHIYCVEQSVPFICGNNFADARDGKIYPTVQIGTQCWMAKNLNVGTKITSCTNGFVSGTTSCTSGGDTLQNQGTSCTSIQKYCYSDNEANCTTNGGLYQWNQAMCGSTTAGAQGICPAGWHLPSDPEQYTLENYLKDSGQTCSSTRANVFDCSTAGTKLKAGGSSGFNSPLTGTRHNLGYFLNNSVDTWLWSSTIYSSSAAMARQLYSSEAGVARFTAMGNLYGFSVRCVKDIGPKRVFITSTTYNGNLGGLAGADAKCTDRASAGGLGGNWKAWLSSSAIAAADRLVQTSYPYRLVNGTAIANNWADLIDGTLASTISITELGTSVSDYGVWTNTTLSGTRFSTTADQTCTDWTTSGSSNAEIGLANNTSSYWTDRYGQACSNLFHLYCFEQ